MSISLTINAENPDDLRAQLSAMLGAHSPPARDATSSPKKTSTASAKTSDAAEPAAPAENSDPKVSQESQPSDDTTAPTDAGTSTQPTTTSGADATDEDAAKTFYDEKIKVGVLKLAQTKGRDAVISMLSVFNVDNASKVPAEDYPALLTAIEKALEQ